MAIGNSREPVRITTTPATRPPAPTASRTGIGSPVKSGPRCTTPTTTAGAVGAPVGPRTRAPQPSSAPRNVTSSRRPLARARTTAGTIASRMPVSKRTSPKNGTARIGPSHRASGATTAGNAIDATTPRQEAGPGGNGAETREARRLWHRHQPPGQPDGDGNEGAEQPKDGRAGGHRSDRDYLPGRTGRTTVYPANSPP